MIITKLCQNVELYDKLGPEPLNLMKKSCLREKHT